MHEIIPLPDNIPMDLDTASRMMTEQGVRLRVIPRHVFLYSHTLVVNGELQVVSDAHVQELGMFACVDQKTGKVVNGEDRSRALVVVLPRGQFQCINLDDPNERPTETSWNRRY